MRSSVLAAALVVVGLLGAGCSNGSAPADDGVPAVATTGASAQPILVTTDWGVVDGMLSVVVKNTSDRTLRSAQGVISARDASDVLVATTADGSAGACCSVVDLPPGQEYGFYVDAGASADDITGVDVAYRNVSWAPADDTSTSVLSAHPVSLAPNDRGTVVAADVKSSARLVPQASVQAFLDGPDGKFLAVVSGRWACFAQGTDEIRMQLLHPVPDGTTVDRVLIHPVTDEPDQPSASCAAPRAARKHHRS